MRNPSTTAIKDGDLSRLTTLSASSSSSSTSSSSSASASSRRGINKTTHNGSFYIPDGCETAAANQTTNFSYVPETGEGLEWHQSSSSASSRKRKDRQDSTSSSNQDHKLIRSNSEEYIPTVDYDVIRRVCSHEEFKPTSALAVATVPLQDKTNGNVVGLNKTSCSLLKAVAADPDHHSNEVRDLRDNNHKQRVEISPARSRTFDFSHKYRISPNRDAATGNRSIGGGNSSGFRSDDLDGEHERRRCSERFCKARAQPGRKSSSKKPQKHLASRLRGGGRGDENAYRYESHKGRGFITSVAKVATVVQSKADEETSIGDFQTNNNNNNNNNSNNNNNNTGHHIKANKLISDTLPWDRSHYDDNNAPVVCPRFADSTFDHVHHSRGIGSAANHLRGNAAAAAATALLPPSNGGVHGHLIKVENLKTREIMQNIKQPPNVFAGPEEKLRQVNKRLTALRKRMVTYEETFEKENGYRPTTSDKAASRSIRNVVTEMHKLKKEKQQLKGDSIGAALKLKLLAVTTASNNNLGVPGGGGGGGGGSGQASRVPKMQETLLDIEKVSFTFISYFLIFLYYLKRIDI